MKFFASVAACSIAFVSMHAAAADNCRFDQIGDPRNGMVYSAEVRVAGASPASALGQMAAHASEYELQAGPEGNSERRFFRDGRPPLTLMATVQGNGSIMLMTKLGRGDKTTEQQARSMMCGLLSRIKPGKEGERVANAARRAAENAPVTVVKAETLSAELGREAKRAVASGTRISMKGLLVGGEVVDRNRSDVDAAFAPFAAKYLGKRYRIDGQVYTVDREGSFMGAGGMVSGIHYLVTPTRGLLRIRQDSTFNNNNFTISCRFARDQAAFAMTLKERDWVTLEGTVSEVDPSGMELQNCRQVRSN